MKPITVVLADDATVVRKGLVFLLNHEPDIEVVGEAGDGREAMRQVKELKPDVVVMDIRMPNLNGIEATGQIRRAYPEVRVVVLTNAAEEEYVFRLLKAGAEGYVLKNAAAEDLVSAIRAVVLGEKYLSPSVSSILIREYLKNADGNLPPDSPEVLSPREREVLQLIAEGHSGPEIAEILSMSARTVNVHREHIRQKLDLRSTAEMVKYAIRKGLTQIDPTEERLEDHPEE